MVNARHFKAFVAAAAFLTLPLIAEAVTFSGSSGTLSASVSFTVVGSDLVVTLTNTSPNDALVPTDILSAVFFSATGDPLLLRTSAVLNTGSTTILTGGGSGSGTDPGGVVGGEWGYLNNLNVLGGKNEGISATGLNLFGPTSLFPGSNLEGPVDPDGIQYGLTSAGDNTATGNGGLQNNTLIKNSVVFHLGLNGQAFDVSDITGVSFLYGTALTETIVPGNCVNCVPRVPEPGTLMFLGGSTLGLLGLTSWRRRGRA